MNVHDKDTEKRRARLFRNGRSQAVRIPKEFEFEGAEVLIGRDEAGRLTLESVRPTMSAQKLIEWLRNQPPLDEDFAEINDFPPEPVDLGLPE